MNAVLGVARPRLPLYVPDTAIPDTPGGNVIATVKPLPVRVLSLHPVVTLDIRRIERKHLLPQYNLDGVHGHLANR
ncbi:MAG: hypothetical protein IPM64_08705 [Phycisphaerales bacterium]|nr:hypothetical protein [Phycisphaerales bacterium]